MLDRVRTHEEYLSFMLPRIRGLFLEKPGQVLFFLDAALKSYVLDFDKGIKILQGCYSQDFGRLAKFDLVGMLRSLVLKVPLGITSITKWAEYISNSDVLDILSGFVQGRTPSMSAFYDFWNRLWLEDKMLQKNARKGEKMPNKRPGVVDRQSGLSAKAGSFPPNAPSGCCRSCSPRCLLKVSRIEILSLWRWYPLVRAPLLNPAAVPLVYRYVNAAGKVSSSAIAPAGIAMFTFVAEIYIRFFVLMVRFCYHQ